MYHNCSQRSFDLMFGKFKKKADSVETPSKQKNDLFTLLEETPNSKSEISFTNSKVEENPGKESKKLDSPPSFKNE